MKILKNILLATDFSKSSEYVLNNAIDMAKIFQSEITPIYVLPNDIANKKAKDLLNDFATKELYDITVKISRAGIAATEPILDYGSFSDKIVQAADKTHANMIMIGAGEKLDNEVFILGSNAKKIIKKSSQPVFVVKNQKQLDIKKILCPVDFSDESGRALDNAITMARRLEAELVVFTAYEVSHLYLIQHRINIEKEIANIRMDKEEALEAFLAKYELAGLKVIAEIEQGAADDAILKAVKKHNSVLLIIANTGKSGLSKILLGSVAEKVIQQVSSSFIIIKNEDVIELELQSKIRTIDEHYTLAQQLFKDGFFEESINKFKACLDINFMHLPTLEALAEVYKTIGDAVNEKRYTNMKNQVFDRMTKE